MIVMLGSHGSEQAAWDFIFAIDIFCNVGIMLKDFYLT